MLAIESGFASLTVQPSSYSDGLAVYAVREDDDWPADGALHVTKYSATVFQVLYAATGLIYVRRAQSVSLWAAWKTIDTTAV